jgi:hypothetical protein
VSARSCSPIFLALADARPITRVALRQRLSMHGLQTGSQFSISAV